MKQILLGIMLAFLLVGSVGAATTVQTNWNGGGNFDTHFTADDDANADFWTGGSVISGEWHASDANDNPYTYGVDNVEAKVKASVENGFMEYKFDRTDSKVSMYGESGQQSYTYINTAGTGDFAWRSTSNYASLLSSNYGWQANGQIQATGSHTIIHTFEANEFEWAGIRVVADATTYISDMSESGRGSSYKFGKGNGCYTNAEVDIDGSGIFDLNAYADNSITTDTGITTDGFLNVHAEFSNGFHYNNFALEGN